MVRNKVEKTKFMIDLKDLLMKKNKERYNSNGEMFKTSESTAILYIKYLSILNGGPFDNLLFLKNTNDIEEKLKKYKISTQKTIIASIISVLDIYKKIPAFKEIIDHYNTLMKKIVNEYKQNYNGNEKTEKQKDNWITKDGINEKFNILYDKYTLFKNNEKLSKEQYDDLLKLLLISLYGVLLEPRRNADFRYMFLSSVDSENINNPNKNFYFPEIKSFIFNKYKSVKNYGSQIIKLDKKNDHELIDILDTYIRYHPILNNEKNEDLIIDNVPFLVSYRGKSLNNKDSINKILSKTFDNKKIGPSLMRNIYVSNNLQPAIKEIEKVAENMGTSVNKLINVYNKTD